MAGDVLNRDWTLSLDVFQAVRDDRPKSEKWELIDGVPVMMPPPTLAHQRISGNLYRLLSARLEAVKPEWLVQFGIGLLLPGDEKFNTEPDLSVIDTDVEPGQICGDRFYMVVEILSGSDKPAAFAAKLRYYKGHEHNRCILFVRQDQIGVTLHERDQSAAWRERELTRPDDALELPEIGLVCTVGLLYPRTVLDPSGRSAPIKG